MDIGCGQGLLGIQAIKKNSKIVLFQDYNKEVLDYICLKNLFANDIAEETIARKIVFVSGE